MHPSPDRPKTPPPRDEREKPGAAAEPRATMRASREDEDNPRRDEPLEEPGYGHGV